jgi:hypothetical protein
MTNRRDDSSGDRESPASSDERDLGWGGREWADRDDAAPGTDPDVQRLLAERPPHHEARER